METSNQRHRHEVTTRLCSIEGKEGWADVVPSLISSAVLNVEDGSMQGWELGHV